MISRLKRAVQRRANQRFGRLRPMAPSQLRLSEQAARRHSQMVRWARIILPGSALLLVISFAFSATPASVDEAFVKQFTYLDQPSENFTMDRPRYAGEDAKGRAYEISAATAEQNPEQPDRIMLNTLDGIRSPGDEDQLQVSADTGLYLREAGQLDLKTNVELEQGIGGRDYVVSTSAATVDLGDRELVSRSGVIGSSEEGSFTARKMTVYQGEGKVVLEDVRMRFDAPKPSEIAEEQAE